MRIGWIVLCFLFAASFAAAQPAPAPTPFDDGVEALRKGQSAVAFDIWHKAAEAGDARSQYGVGYLYQFGLGVDPDNREASKWYEKAAAQNDPNGLFALGLMYESGRIGKRDRLKAIGLYKRAAATGHSPDAEYALARMYREGRGVARDEKQALDWAHKAAMEGQPGAQYMLGEAYEVGSVVKADKIEAYYWYTAALDGDPDVLRESDPEFNPKDALKVLAAHMTRSQIAAANAKLKKNPPPVAPQPYVPAGTKG